MNKVIVSGQSTVTDLRERCPTCDMIAPQHRKWCITPVVQGERIMETRQIEGEQSVPLMGPDNE